MIWYSLKNTEQFQWSNEIIENEKEKQTSQYKT